MQSRRSSFRDLRSILELTLCFDFFEKTTVLNPNEIQSQKSAKEFRITRTGVGRMFRCTNELHRHRCVEMSDHLSETQIKCSNCSLWFSEGSPNAKSSLFVVVECELK